MVVCSKIIISVMMVTYIYHSMIYGVIVCFLKVNVVPLVLMVFPFRDPSLGPNIYSSFIMSDLFTGHFGG